MVLLLVILILVFVLTNETTIKDWYILATYTPPKVIVNIADTDTMTSYAKTLFYVNKPQLDDKADFAIHCPNGLEEDYVLGCYHTGDRGIYILDVNNPKLKTLDSVTGAYEMLHAAYGRLSSEQRNNLDQVMNDFYSKHINSSEIKSQMAAYAATEPGAKDDELFSVLATEVSVIPQTLSKQYSLYFYNRSKLVQMFNQYQEAFNTRLAEVKADDTQLAKLMLTIKNNETTISNLNATINQESKLLSSELAGGDLNQYNLAISNYNSQVNQYNQLILSTRADISQYNLLVDSRNSLVLAEQQLVKAISPYSKSVLTTK